MAYPFPSCGEPFNQPNLIARLRRTFEDLPDACHPGGNTRYAMEDATLSAFSVFFMQSRFSWPGRGACRSAKAGTTRKACLGCIRSPTDNQIRNLLEPVLPEYLYPVFRYVGQRTGANRSSGCLLCARGLSAAGHGWYGVFSSTQIQCECCSHQRLEHGQAHYFHAAVTPVTVAPNQRSVIPLALEFITPQDGADKQDSELTATKRWLKQETGHLPPAVTVPGDDLYCH
jgi:hypothetical protein